MNVLKKCPVCLHEQFEPFMQVNDHSISKENFELMQCGSCFFIFTQNTPAENEIGPYYQSEEYISHSDTNKGLVNRLYHLVRTIMLGKKWKIIRNFTPGKKILDVGSGTGYFLQFMKEKGYQTMGVEVSDDAKNIAINKFGLDIRSPQELIDGKIEENVDAITLWHVLEHLYDLDKYMQVFNRSLDKDGILAIAVPNNDSYDAHHYKSYWAAYDVPRHLWHFTPNTMEKLASRHGFSIVSLKKLPFDAFYNSMLSEKYKANKFFLVSGFIIGFISYINSIFSIRKSSSIVYLLKKSNNGQTT